MKAAVVKKQGILPVIEEIDKPTSTSEGDLILRDWDKTQPLIFAICH